MLCTVHKLVNNEMLYLVSILLRLKANLAIGTMIFQKLISMFDGLTPRFFIRWAMRQVSTSVLPELGPANTLTQFALVLTAAACSSFKPIAETICLQYPAGTRVVVLSGNI